MSPSTLRVPVKVSVVFKRYPLKSWSPGYDTLAVLAKTANMAIEGDYEPSEYLSAAINGFDHLEKNNVKYR